MTDSDDLMDAFPGFSLWCHKKRDHFEQKEKKKPKENFFFSDYPTVSFVTILRMNASLCINKV